MPTKTSTSLLSLLKTKRLVSYFVILVCSISSTSCQTEEKSSDENDNIKTIYEQKISQDFIKMVALSPEAEAITTDWEAYLAIRTELERTQNMTLGEVLNNAENIVRISDSLQTKLPDTFQVDQIKARLKLIETQAKIQQQLLARRIEDTVAIKQSIYKLLQGFNSLNIQINERFIQTPQFIEPQ